MVFLRALQPRPEDAEYSVDELVVSEIGDPSNGRVLATSSDGEGYLATFLDQPTFSPDGSQVMFVRWHRMGEGYGSDAMETSLWVVPADGSAPARQLDRSKFVGFGFWDPSGRWIVYGDPEGVNNPESTAPLTVISVETGEKHTIVDRRMLASTGITYLRAKAWSPDGRWIGATGTKGGYELWVIADLLGGSSGGSR
jgi:Tol biopolymer transport system component